MPIQNHRDHAANERTFLAWVRTAIAIIGLGFLVERFDLFIATSANSAAKRQIAGTPGDFGHIAGLTLIVLGMIMIGVAAWRFARTAREIDDDKRFPGTGSRTDYALAALLIILMGGLLFYLFNSVTKGA